MHAVRIHAFGDPEVLQFEEVRRPEPGISEVLIKVLAADINFVDTTIRQGNYPVEGIKEIIPPFIPGSEIAGIVEHVGDNVTRFQSGDRVAALIGYAGGYAEYVVCNANRP